MMRTVLFSTRSRYFMDPIRIGIIGVGNCASALLQGIAYYRRHNGEDATGILFWNIGPYSPAHIAVTCAFDIDARKVGRDVHEAVFADPNCTTTLTDELPLSGVHVSMGKILDGCARHMFEHAPRYRFVPSDEAEPEKSDVVRILRQSNTEILLNYLPVGSEMATRFYADCALEAGVAFVNNIPVFLASDREYAERFQTAGIPLIGDDIKSQIGATIVHRTLADLFARRGVRLDRTYQMNSGGNTDFLNMLDRQRLTSKKTSKTEAVRSQIPSALDERDIHIGPSDYIPWLKDNKIAFIRMEGRIFGNIPMNLELRLSVEDSPNSAGAAIDCIRLCKLALDRSLGGVLESPSALYCKRPPTQYQDDRAYDMVKEFIDRQSR